MITAGQGAAQRASARKMSQRLRPWAGTAEAAGIDSVTCPIGAGGAALTVEESWRGPRNQRNSRPPARVEPSSTVQAAISIIAQPKSLFT